MYAISKSEKIFLGLLRNSCLTRYRVHVNKKIKVYWNSTVSPLNSMTFITLVSILVKIFTDDLFWEIKKSYSRTCIQLIKSQDYLDFSMKTALWNPFHCEISRILNFLLWVWVVNFAKRILWRHERKQINQSKDKYLTRTDKNPNDKEPIRLSLNGS